MTFSSSLPNCCSRECSDWPATNSIKMLNRFFRLHLTLQRTQVVRFNMRFVRFIITTVVSPIFHRMRYDPGYKSANRLLQIFDQLKIKQPKAQHPKKCGAVEYTDNHLNGYVHWRVLNLPWHKITNMEWWIIQNITKNNTVSLDRLKRYTSLKLHRVCYPKHTINFHILRWRTFQNHKAKQYSDVEVCSSGGFRSPFAMSESYKYTESEWYGMKHPKSINLSLSKKDLFITRSLQWYNFCTSEDPAICWQTNDNWTP